MPMMPSTAAAGVYLTVKLVGYAVFAIALNRVAGKSVSPYKFTAAKTALGLAGGIGYLIIINVISDDLSDLTFWAGAIPIRLLAWVLVLGYFYGFKEQTILIAAAAFAGVAWSYLLDWLMSFFYKVLPGMESPWC